MSRSINPSLGIAGISKKPAQCGEGDEGNESNKNGWCNKSDKNNKGNQCDKVGKDGIIEGANPSGMASTDKMP